MRVTRRSPFSDKQHTMDLPITAEEVARWTIGGELIQNVWPNLSADEREFLMTGITPEEWAETFGDEED